MSHSSSCICPECTGPSEVHQRARYRPPREKRKIPWARIFFSILGGLGEEE